MFVSFQMVILFFLSLIIGLRAATVNHTSGVAFANSNQIYFSSGTWDLTYKIDMHNFLSSAIEFKKCKTQVDIICSNLNDENNCPYFKKFMTQYENSLKYNVEKVKNLMRRKKRFIVFIVIYALMDYYFFDNNIDQEIIDSLQRADNDLRDFTSEHIDITNKTINVEKKLFSAIVNNVKMLHIKLNQITKLKKKDNIRLQLGNIIQAMTLMTIETNKVMENLFKLVYREKSADFISLIGEEILFKNVKQISERLEKHQRLPFEVHTDNLWEIQRLSDVSFMLTDENLLIIKIRIPIIENMKFTYYEITPIPIKINKTMIVINNIAQGIIFNDQNNNHVLTSNNFVEKCEEIFNDSLMCHSNVIFDKQMGCEMNMIKQNSTEKCNFVLIPLRNYVIKVSKNAFYILPNKECKITVKCKNQSEINYSFESGNMIYLDSGCSIENSYFKYSLEDEIEDNAVVIPSIDNKIEINLNEEVYFEPLNDSMLILNITEQYKLIDEELMILRNRTNGKFERILQQPKYVGIIFTICNAIFLFLCIKFCCKIILKKI